MPARIVIHAGFHKTGTSSVQAMLSTNKPALGPHLRVLLRKDFEALTNWTRRASASRDPADLRVVRRKAFVVFRDLTPDDARPVLLSAEDLAGVLPGRRGVPGYDVTGAILTAICDGIGQAWGEAAQPLFYFSTRAAEPWLRSVWWQNLRATRLTDDLDTFRRTHAGAADLEKVLRRAAETCPAPVTSFALEDTAPFRLGPAEPLLELAGIAAEVRAGLDPAERVNSTPDPEIQAEFLKLNRSGLSNEAVSGRKRAALRRA